jgi:HK97 family phage portal protein
MTITASIWTSTVGFLTGRYADDNPALVERGAGGGSSFYLDSGSPRGAVPYNDGLATTITAVYRSVQLIASTIASFPLHVYEKQADGSRQRVEYRQDTYLWLRPNPEVTSTTFWETVIGHEVLSGNAYLWVVDRKDGGRELWPIEPRRVRVGRDADGDKFYTIDGREARYRDYIVGGDLVHIPGWGYDGLQGVSPIRQFAQTLALTNGAEEYAARLFTQGALNRGILQTDLALDADTAREIADRFTAANRGMQNAHRTAIIDRGLKWQATSINPEDAQMLATRQFQVAEVGRMFGIPEHLIGSHDKTSSWGQGLEVNNQAFISYTLQPHLIRFEQAIGDELLRGLRYVKFNTGGLLRGTNQERAAFYEVMQRLGVYTINDILALEDMAGIGEQGDARLVPLNIGRLDESGTPVGPTPPEAPALPAPVA